MMDRATGLVLTSPDGVRYRFDPGALCLELLLTGGPGEIARYESLHEPAGLLEWVVHSRLRPTPELRVSGEELAETRRARDALWRLVWARTGRGEASVEDLGVLNAAAARPPLAPALYADGVGWAAGPAAGEQLLSTVARDAVALLGGPYAGRIRECGAHDCRLVFVDTSRPGRRRWCSMGRCGNRNKVRALRARQHLEG
ncbi:CGNR zinc finger domain-containing protein [Streptomyces alkaliterrae]|uniref:CGNR zinc finger domain-containing protein n=3 Tax=Streptomyces alkaliterrae TaxID=2213162 RepID=A0A7W3X1L2_9ACTN|nr:CGNR zinc finger domain-containing protein [Streptomyces alkaliterrae]MBB1262471.1 CGNR zinc finger domain-containing protein [Streptomyces alkaliterrae]